ncbi:site-specific integrase [Desulfurivibrio alkaliphilus]|uniref:Integrase family protein n=1 Tax=Desulfurivibrio alkaliphilus (strain DSM 19089 / UNIQEM U267 / AHT2) TaxID=589865 RepID=D6Z682_DESAT|nr:site-specific integrase [Desulfurivibrio alkaliphilus]ADH86847.1 integrase family protein [Desulfurivibrio alkaliphilus AHT 2]
MRGSIKWQVQEISKSVNHIGTSRHSAKETARSAGARTSAQVAEKTGIHSYRTREAYLKVWRQCLSHSKEHHGVKDITKLTGEHVQSFLSSRIADGVSRQTYGQAAAALGKLESALNSYATSKGLERSYDFRTEIRTLRHEARDLRTMEAGRAFRDPDRVMAGLRDPDYRLTAAIQRETGCRLSEATLIRAEQLRGGGQVEIRGKGGKERTLRMSADTYRQLAARIAEQGEHRVSRDAYRAAVSRAAEAAGERGSNHGFRHLWVQERFREKIGYGMSREQAMAEVSREIGHERPDITLHYLGGR